MKKRCFVLCLTLGSFLLFGSGKSYAIEPLESYLPEIIGEKLKIKLQMRYRLEVRDNFDFNDSADDDDAFNLLRTRLNLDYNLSEYFRAFVQVQDSRLWESQFTNKTGYKDEVDIRQSFIDIRDIVEGLTLRVGRQELSYGDQRLIGGFNWSNVAQNFDAAKFIYNIGEDLQIDAFASRKVVIDTGNFNGWDDDDNFYGLYGMYSGVDKHTIDIYYLFRETTRTVAFGSNVGSNELEESTVGFRIRGKGIYGFDYTLENAYQFGNFGEAGEDIKAWALVALAGYTFDIPWSPRIGVEWDFASGDEETGDNERNTFDNLYPTNHLHYGYMDRASLQNLNSWRFTANAKPTKKLYLQADLHLISLDETTDSLYNAGRTAMRTSASGNVDDFVGSDLDFTVKYKLCKNSKLLVGYSHFFAGDFLKDTGANDDGDFFYFQTSVSF